MKNREKVSIKISARKIKSISKTNRQTNVFKPRMNLFLFKPRLFEQIAESVLSLNWNDKNKQIYIEMTETADFDVLKWIKYIQDAYEKTENYDREFASSVVLYFLNDTNQKIAQIQFRELNLIEHNCPMDINPNKNLSLKHNITVGYKYSEFLLSKNEQDRLEFPAPPSNADDEWQKA